MADKRESTENAVHQDEDELQVRPSNVEEGLHLLAEIAADIDQMCRENAPLCSRLQTIHSLLNGQDEIFFNFTNPPENISILPYDGYDGVSLRNDQDEIFFNFTNTPENISILPYDGYDGVSADFVMEENFADVMADNQIQSAAAAAAYHATPGYDQILEKNLVDSVIAATAAAAAITWMSDNMDDTGDYQNF